MGHWPKHIGLAGLLATMGMLFSAPGAGALPCLTCPGGGGGGPTGDPTTTSVIANPGIGQFGQTVTFTATVKDSADSSATPTGTVTFHDGSTSATVGLSGGTASYSVKPPLGSTTVSADYTPSSTDLYLPSSGSGSATVAPDGTMTTLSSSKNPSSYGDAVTFTATVTAPFDSPTGSVTFRDGATTLATAALSGDTATLTTNQLTPGSHSITAQYGGDPDNSGSTSSALTQTVNEDSTATALTSSSNPAGAGDPVTLTAKVTNTANGALTPTGSVTFLDGSTTLGTVSLLNGQASYVTSTLAAGSHSISAVYSGDANDAASSNGLTQVISPPSTNSGGGTTGSGGTTTGSSTGTSTSNPQTPSTGSGPGKPKSSGAKCVKVSKKKGKRGKKGKACSKPKAKPKKKAKKH